LVCSAGSARLLVMLVAVEQAAGGTIVSNVQRIEWEIAPLHAGIWSLMCNLRVTARIRASP
jgi:hypothetical protein